MRGKGEAEKISEDPFSTFLLRFTNGRATRTFPVVPRLTVAMGASTFPNLEAPHLAGVRKGITKPNPASSVGLFKFQFHT